MVISLESATKKKLHLYEKTYRTVRTDTFDPCKKTFYCSKRVLVPNRYMVPSSTYVLRESNSKIK